MKIPKTIRRGFSFDESIFFATLSKRIYEIFQYEKNLGDREIKKIYNSMYEDNEWNFIHIIRNEDTNVRGLILKNKTSHKYIVVFRGSIVTDGGAFEFTDFITDTQWDLIKYPLAKNHKVRVVEGFYNVFESVKDQVIIFFKTLAGQLEAKDFAYIRGLETDRQLACCSSIADAGSVRLGTNFEEKAKDLIFGVITKEDNLKNQDLEIINEFEEALLNLGPVGNDLQVYVTGHSLGGCITNICALALKKEINNLNFKLKVYTFGTPKVGNESFAEYYNKQIPSGFSYRIENRVDLAPYIPLPLPFPLNLLVTNGVRVGDVYISNYSGVGEVHQVIGIGSQGVSLDFGGAIELLGGIPFPHSFDTYLQLLENEKQFWQHLSQPLRDIFGSLVKELLVEQNTEIKLNFQQEIENLQMNITQLKNEIQYLKEEKDHQDFYNQQESYKESLTMAFPNLKEDVLNLLLPKITEVTYQPGENIVKQGDIANKFYVISEGTVEILIENYGENRIVREMTQGGYFGEIGLIIGAYRTATVRAKGNNTVKVIVFNKENFEFLISESELTGTQITYHLSQRLMNYMFK